MNQIKYVVQGVGELGVDVSSPLFERASSAVIYSHACGGHGACFTRLDGQGFVSKHAPMRFYTSRYALEQNRYTPLLTDCIYAFESTLDNDLDAIEEVALKIIGGNSPMHVRYDALFIYVLELNQSGDIVSIDGTPIVKAASELETSVADLHARYLTAHT